MKIGLVRHFKVNKPYPKGGRLDAGELAQWFTEYDLADIEAGSTDLEDVPWQICYVSDMPRAVRTAEHIYTGPIRQTAALREIDTPQFRIRLKLPFLLWGLLIRFAWWTDPRTRHHIKQAEQRIRQVLDEITARFPDGNVLIVSHAALMKYMRKELIRRGFAGPSFGYARNGKLYTFKLTKSTR